MRFQGKHWMWIGVVARCVPPFLGTILLATGNLYPFMGLALLCMYVVGQWIAHVHSEEADKKIRTSILLILHCLPRNATMDGMKLWRHPVLNPKPSGPDLDRVLERMRNDGLIKMMKYGHVRSDSMYFLTNKGHAAARAQASKKP